MLASSFSFVRSRSCATLLLVGALSLSTRTAGAQYQNPGSASQPEAPTPGTSADRPRFSVDATLQLGETGEPTVRLDYRMSRSELLFERTPPAGYHAAYEVRVIFFREKGNRQVTGDTYTRELRAPSYAATRQRGEDMADHLDFHLPPGKYRVEVAVTDLVAERTSATVVPIEVPAAPPGLVWFSDLTLGVLDPPSGGPDARFVPNPSRRYGDNIVAFAASGEIFDRRPEHTADSTYRIPRLRSTPSGPPFCSGRGSRTWEPAATASRWR